MYQTYGSRTPIIGDNRPLCKAGQAAIGENNEMLVLPA